MQTRYQILKRSDHAPSVRIGGLYKSKQRARNRCDKLDNIHGSYVHFIEPIEVLVLTGGPNWERR